MNQFKTPFIALSLFALFAVNAAAQCGGKTVYIQLPSTWNPGNSTTIYFKFLGMESLSLTKNGNWWVGKFKSLNNDGSGQEFTFSNLSTEGQEAGRWIGKTNYDVVGGNGQSSSGKFKCSDFGSSSSIYISENPNSKGKTVWGTNPPDAKVLYFFPPDDPKWISGKSYLKTGDANAKLMGVDPNKCGWYRAVYFNESPPDFIQIWLGANGMDKIGSKGRQDDLESDDAGAIELADKFSQIGDTIWFVADEGYADGWSKTDPEVGDGSRCRYNLAAFIYDTDPSVHPDFSCGVYKDEDYCSETPENFNKKTSCTGVIKGLAKTTLNKETKKIECGDCTKNSCWTDADWFSKAFTATKGVNVQHCYDMPFTQAANGRYEFDSDVMTQDGTKNGRLVGGFFPKVLNDAQNTDPEYADCPYCATKRQAEVFVPIDTRTWDRDTYMSYQSKEGDFANGDEPKYAWDWGARDKLSWYLWGNTAIAGTKSGMANEHFCFESHAQFIYDPEQEFYFTGDDDIWVYVNDTLVVDLGGAHMAAPGHIKLKDIEGSYAMTEGKQYPIDIFFCDRRTTQSNVRISTNMYVMQKQRFYVKSPRSSIQEICMQKSNGSDCASAMGLGGDDSEDCGNDLIKNNPGYKLEFYMLPTRSKDTLWLSRGPSINSKCTGSGNDFNCYNGIKVENAVYSCGGKKQCQNNSEATATLELVGSYNVWAALKDANGNQVGKPILIDVIKNSTPITDPNPIITRHHIGSIKARVENNFILLSNLPPNAKIKLYNLQGKRIYFGNSENSQILRIPVQTKGMYIVTIQENQGSVKVQTKVVVK